MSTPRDTAAPSLMRATSLMAAGTLVSRVLGFARASMTITLLGVTNALVADTFATANTVPNQLYNLVAGGLLNAVLVPQISRAARHADGGRAFLDRLLTVSLLALGAVTALATLAAPLVPVVLGPGSATGQRWDASTSALCVAFAFWCLPQVFFYGLYTVLGQVLNARGRFGAYMWAPVLNNVVAIAGLAVLLVQLGPARPGHPSVAQFGAGHVAVLAGTATLGVALQALVLLVPLHRLGFRWRPRLGLRGVGLGGAGRIAAWTFAAALLGQLGYVVTVRVVNAAGQGGGPGQNAYGPSFLLVQLPHSLVTVSLVTALFTRMSRAAADGDTAGVRRDVSVGLRLTGVATVLALVAVAGLGRDLVGALFHSEHGGTDAIAAATTAMMFGLVPFSAQYLFQRAFYALEDARTPFLVQLPVVAVIALGSFLAGTLLPATQVVVGVGVGMAAGYGVGAVLSAALLHRRLGSLQGTRVLRTYVRLVAAGVPSAAAAFGVSRVLHAAFGSGRAVSVLALVAGGAVLLAGYAGLCRLMHVAELDEVVGPLLRRLPGRGDRGAAEPS